MAKFTSGWTLSELYAGKGGTPKKIVSDMTGKNYMTDNPKWRKQFRDQKAYDAEENRLSSAFPSYPAMTTSDKHSLPTRYAKTIIDANDRQKAKWWSLKK